MTSTPSTFPHTAIVGLQWGDEGKGKIVDVLTAEHDVIVRYNGGANAGHTVVAGDERYALHLIPSGILYPEKQCVIGNGVVIDPEKILEEIDGLRDRGIEVGSNLTISDRAHVVMPYHKALDAALEVALTGMKQSGGPQLAIGTTKRGIGPAYADKVTRSTAIRMRDLLDADRLRARLEILVPMRRAELEALGGDIEPTTLDIDHLTDAFAAFGRRLAPHLADTTYTLHDAIADGRSLLFEGANASLLDIDHGTYPYVTSSNCTTLGIPAGTGVPARTVERVVGIMKAYSTRVGSGPFPTELADATGDRIRDAGNEYGTTTGRPRRCGWLDLVAVRYACLINGVTALSVMLLDVLSGFDELQICTAYRLPDGTVTDRFPPDAVTLDQIEPIFETIPGWSEPIDHAKSRSELPANAQAYLDRIEALTGVPIAIISVGPERTQTIRTP